MNKYPIDKEFSKIKNFKPPFSRLVFPFANAFLSLFMPKSDKRVSVNKITLYENGNKFCGLLIKPKSTTEPIPCLVYFHGGGFCFKASPKHNTLTKEYAVKANCAVFSVDYSLSPRAKFPKAINEAVTSFNYIKSHAKELTIDENQILIGGDSAGGCIAAAATEKLIENTSVSPQALLLIYPVLDGTMSTKSMKTYRDTPIWNGELNEKMWNYYLPEKTDRKNSLVSPIFSKNLSLFPKTYIETTEFDCLHNEGMLFKERLIDNNVEVVFNETKGTVHGFDTVSSGKLSKNAIEQRIEFLKKAIR